MEKKYEPQPVPKCTRCGRSNKDCCCNGSVKDSSHGLTEGTAMDQIIAYLKEQQREYYKDTSAYKVLRKLEVTLPGLFAQSSPPSPPITTIEKIPGIVRFICGECEFKGVWYGEDKIPSGEKGKFWWRKYLRELFEKQ